MEAADSKTNLAREEKPPHNCCTSTINISYQIVLQDHNYGAPLPQDYAPAVSAKHEPKAEFPQGGQYPVQAGRPIDSLKGMKTLTPRAGNAGGPPAILNRTPKVNGASTTPIKQQQKAFGNSTPVLATHLGSPVNSRSKIGLPTLPFGNAQPPPLPSTSLGKIPGDLNSHLYASVTVDKPEEPKAVNGIPPAASGGLVSFLGNINEWLSRERLQEKAKARAELHDTFNDDSADSLDSPLGIDTDNDGEETETAPECEGEEDPEQEESITRCICKFGHDDGYMICCDRCSVWQHVDCMGLDRTNIPDEYLCDQCHPRRIDRARARAVQYRKRQEFRLSTPPPANSRDRYNTNGGRRDDFIDVEKTTPRKQLAKAKLGTKTVAAAAASSSSTTASASKNLTKGVDTLKGRKVTLGKWKRKSSDKLDEADKEKPNAPRKRKVSRAKSSEGLPASSALEGTPVKSSQAAADLLVQWIEHYEEAVTNHYSPELRARVATVRPTSSNVPFVDAQFVAPGADRPLFRVTSKRGGYKTLEASQPIRAGEPIIEVQGKYMLTNQLRPYKTGDSGSGAAIRPSPHIIYIQLYGNSDATSPAPVIDVCVDGRSYGNEARFAWQSCQPNAEVKLSIEKNSVHLYLVAKMNIGEGEEISLPHETKNPLSCTFEGCPYQNARTVQREFAKGAAAASEKRRRRRTNSTAGSTPAPVAATPVTTPTAAAESSPVVAEAPVTTPPPRVRRSSSSTNSPAKRQQRLPSKTANSGSDEQQGPEGEVPSEERAAMDAESCASKDKKLSREERKMEAIMKAFERMEKAEQRRQEALAKQAHRKDHRDSKEGTNSGRDDDLDIIGASLEEHAERRPLSLRKRKRGGRVRRSSSSSSLQKTRMRALSGEVQSGQSTAEDENQDDINDYASTAFRCPKTKKVVFNTWVADADGNIMKADQHQESGSSPSVAVPVCYMRNPISRSPTRSQRSSLRPPTLTTLKATGSDSPDAFPGDNPGDDGWTAAPAAGSAGGSAKKRWLRQAISEETETDPNSGGQGAPAGEALDHVTPLKKRRFARASLSSETSFTPPSTPTQFCGFNEATPPEAMPTAYDKVREAVEEEQLTSSQSTTPECDELPPVHASLEAHHAEAEIETVDEQELLDIPLPDMEDTPTFLNGFHGPVFLPQHAPPLVKQQPEESPEETPKPTWEFRAPDAQFMRTRTNSDTCDSSSEQQQQSPAPDENLKPAKRKLSILEYRKRQQRLHSEDSDGPRDDSSSGCGSKQGAGSPGAENEEDATKTSPEAVDSSV